MEKKINIFIGGSVDSDISESYRNVAIELGQKINEREDYSITFDGCLGLPFFVFNELDDYTRAKVYKTRYYSNDYIYSTGALIEEFRTQGEFICNIPSDSDAMIFMKGGASTITEVMYAIETKKNGEHDKPIVILNVNDEWSSFTDLLGGLSLNGIYHITDSVNGALNYVEGELFKKSSRFYNKYRQYLGRDEAMIEGDTIFSK